MNKQLEQDSTKENQALHADFSRFILDDLQPLSFPLLKQNIRNVSGVRIDVNERGKAQIVLHSWGQDNNKPDYRLVVTESEHTYLNNIVLQRRVREGEEHPLGIEFIDTNKVNIDEYTAQANRNLWQQFTSFFSRFDTNQQLLMSKLAGRLSELNIEYSQTPFNQTKITDLRSTIHAPNAS